MKKVLLFLTGLILLSMVTNAQKSSAKCFDENTKIINLGIGLGNPYYSFNDGPGYTSRNSPALSLSYEQAWPKRLGPGHMGVGAYLGFQRSSYEWDYAYYYGSNYNEKHSYNNIIIASRAAYHWDGLNFEKADIYGGVILGLRIEADTYTSSDPNYSGHANYSETHVNLAYSLFAGARYYFVPKFSVFGELGYGISYLTVGVGFKL